MVVSILSFRISIASRIIVHTRQCFVTTGHVSWKAFSQSFNLRSRDWKDVRAACFLGVALHSPYRDFAYDHDRVIMFSLVISSTDASISKLVVGPSSIGKS